MNKTSLKIISFLTVALFLFSTTGEEYWGRFRD